MNYKNVEVVTRANVYFDGKVTSRTIIAPSGERKTLGVMLPGTYTFNTDAPERIDVTQGRVRVRISEGEWRGFSAGQSFDVPAKSRFDIEVQELLDYVCHFG